MAIFHLARKIALRGLIYDTRMKVSELTRQIHDLTRYAANIGDGKISFKDMTDIPTRFFQRQSIFQQYAHQSALQVAGMQLATMAPMMMMQMQGQNANPYMMQMYQQSMFMNLYNEARKEAVEHEKKLLNEQEKEIVTEKDKYQAMLDGYEAEIKTIDQVMQKDNEEKYRLA